MTLDRETLVENSVERFFRALNNKDIATVEANFTPDCAMRIPSSDLFYKNAHDTIVHLQEFVETFETINFHDFLVIAEPEKSRLAATFTVRLVDPEGEETVMRNANFFTFAEDGRICDILIIATQPLDKGFQAGRS